MADRIPKRVKIHPTIIRRRRDFSSAVRIIELRGCSRFLGINLIGSGTGSGAISTISLWGSQVFAV
ncbi:unnamed protein product [Periconia digitata]|uniref:Uncharacterized protein n=1 Tax=Periconia digitata TaxID=1303443 RepID=A0A9W4XSB5_9PLEO|nr:unnamed protein product [Periconia digitata]